MFFNLFRLEIKALLRSKQLKTEVFTFLFKAFFLVYLALVLLGLAVLTPEYVAKLYPNQDLFYIITGFFVFYWLYDLFLRYIISGSPIVDIKPLLLINIKHKIIVQYTVCKAYFKLFNVIHLFFFIPLAFILIRSGYDAVSVLGWTLSMLLLLSCNSFISIFLEKINLFFYLFVGLLTFLGFAHIYGWIDILPFTSPLSAFFYQYKFAVVLAVAFVLLFALLTYSYYNTQLYLDKGLSKNEAEIKSLDFKYLTNMGVVGAFIKNDLYLIFRNKRPRTTLLFSLIFIFYPFLFLDFDKELSPAMIFFAIFATGGFMISFGQFVPSWDSAYYPLLMTQNISYRDYLISKWCIMAIACLITLVLCSFYLFFSPVFFLALVAATIFNIGFNAYITLLTGAFMRQGIDLTSNVGAFGNTKSFNVNTLVLSLVILVTPILIQIFFQLLFNVYVGLLAVAVAGLVGFLLREKVINRLVNNYNKNKYRALIDFKN
ncbi:DUF5687 family protein [Flavobacterium agricola]|uniref:DUF5687 family protein n=1 Tax=Flavobacterium agricola TaxID=2870839 RepID=A0ABY6LXE3_9FLAO|nr:DUF5687 family protein [Flavobacterium agricola]UYW00899.1 DUF5687 family protein [Flavobacterium agricola]